ncbi:TfuA-like protein [Sphingosinicella sp. LHD-64]|uniref:TfuA-like protein n=1 Tax=Sphingosinicella sp. LHD-64 TaxID=3072139 RepID=UPI00280F6C10|nr:TfuA-like protein [Sphingosinicella sp. LHD-64]MDQ8755487.1 TfuA-like protein [Sphingosinicella sp. LHD-64]
MTVVAFAGPSLPPEDRAGVYGVEWCPPAEAGDLLRLDAGPELTVCLIDGYFDHRPAVRHKEILLLLSEGVRILGASSIGALRAAEMAALGMIGVGSIYRAYASGRIVGDDEVALIHGPADAGWRPVSIPLVDVRATLCRALRDRMLLLEDARSLLIAAGEIHYIERCWEGLIAASGIPTVVQARLRAWLRDGQMSQKRLDAQACIAAALDNSAIPPIRPPLVRTAFLEALAQECGIAPPWLPSEPVSTARAPTHGGPPAGRDGSEAPSREAVPH